VAYELKLPDLGEGLTEGEVARWLVSEGDVVAEDDPLVEIQTDKTTVEIPSPAAGPVTRILVGAGEIVPVGTVLVVIGGDGAAPPPAAPERIQATPLVRRIAGELGVDLATVAPSGPGGRITESDVRGAAGAGSTEPAEGRREPLRGVRRQIAEHLARAHHEIPAVTFVEECDFGAVDMSLLLPLVLRATALSLRDYPELNARLEATRSSTWTATTSASPCRPTPGSSSPSSVAATHVRSTISAPTSTPSPRRRARARSRRNSSAARPSPSRAPASWQACSSRR